MADDLSLNDPAAQYLADQAPAPAGRPPPPAQVPMGAGAGRGLTLPPAPPAAGAGRGLTVPPMPAGPSTAATAPPIRGTGMDSLEGLNRQVAQRIASEEAKGPGFEAQRAGLGKQGQDVLGEESKALDAKFAALGPNEARQREVAARQLPELRQERADPYKKPVVSPDQVNETMGLMAGVAALFGIVSRRPFMSSMSALTGVMKGWQERDDKLVEQSMQAYEKNLSKIRQNNEAARTEWEAAKEEKKNDLEGLQIEAASIARRYDLPIAQAELRYKGIHDSVTSLDEQMKAWRQGITSMERLQGQITASMARVDQARENNAFKMAMMDLRAATQQGKGTATDKRFMSRVVDEAIIAKADISAVLTSPFDTTGLFGSFKDEHKGIFASGSRAFAANVLTTESAQRMQTLQAGLARSLSMLTNMGLKPSETEVAQFDRLAIVPGDTVGNAQLKIASQATIIRAGVTTAIAGGTLTDDQEKAMRSVLETVDKVPTTEALQKQYYEGTPRPKLMDTPAARSEGGEYLPGLDRESIIWDEQ